MAKTSVPCPQCRQPILIDLTRLFDLNTNPDAKEQLLSGSANAYQCPNCRAQGTYPTPMVYHDPDKELLLTYYPPELMVALPEQERILGPLVKKVIDDLPPEKRKGYIFKPESMLSQKHLFERILQADGITPEMMKAQQDKLRILQTLANTRPENLAEVIRQNDAEIDEELFMLLTRLAQASAAGGDQQSAQALSALQRPLLEHSTFGRKAAAEAQESREAINALHELSQKGLTRENLLDLMLDSADSNVKLTTLASMARSGLDYQFFQLISERAEAAPAEEKKKLEGLRDNLLKVTEEIDKTVKAQVEEAQGLLDELLKAENVEEATQKALPRMSAAFAEVVNASARQAQEANDEAKLQKLAVIATVWQSANASSAYLELIEALLGAPDADGRKALMEQAGDAINSDFLQILGGLISQVEQGQEQTEVLESLKNLNREALRFSMQRNLNKEETA